MDFVDEENGPAMRGLSATGRVREDLAQFLHTGEHRGQRLEVGASPGLVPDGVCEGRLPRPRRSPQDHGEELAARESIAKGLALSEQRLLAEDLLDGFG